MNLSFNPAWLYLLLASVMEVCWNYSLKYTSIAKLRALDWSHFFASSAGWQTLAPAVGYIAFGVGNVIFFSKALSVIPASTAFAIWMGLALVGIKIVDTLVLKEAFQWVHVLYIGFILAGIIGLKTSSKPDAAPQEAAQAVHNQ
ncbi:multidrug efflux SMR transporter [Hymenobacter sp. RP-2-7]|uniref:Guanidinium exporter n=1 Tax=Hymenobacter polaris TaxID=2682546 RepID=A0A7Y0AI79_9BACT|nr:multidrug efflux SMR transporter [Hymenobacter polaris]NML67667.1 multidrug efflux SMR transporter [Hymenobacter polaris]